MENIENYKEKNNNHLESYHPEITTVNFKIFISLFFFTFIYNLMGLLTNSSLVTSAQFFQKAAFWAAFQKDLI